MQSSQGCAVLTYTLFRPVCMQPINPGKTMQKRQEQHMSTGSGRPVSVEKLAFRPARVDRGLEEISLNPGHTVQFHTRFAQSIQGLYSLRN